MVDKFYFDTRANEYVHQMIEWGSQYSKGTSYSLFLLAKSLSEGLVYTYLPTGLKDKSKYSFDRSIYLSTGVSLKKFRQRIYDTILDFLCLGGNRYVVLETLSDSRDKFSHFCTPSNEFVNYFLGSSDAHMENIQYAVRFARYYPFIVCK